MWPLVFCLIASLCVIVGRSLWWLDLRSRCKPDKLTQALEAISRGDFQSAEELTSSSEDPFVSTLHEGIIHAHSSMLGAMQLHAMKELERAEQLQWVLGTLITLAPLLGLMGTVTGIMNSFHFVGHQELATAKVSGGIAEALIATACGLGIAILCLFPHNLFNRLLTQFRSRLENTINHFELLVESAKHRGHDLGAYSKARAVSANFES